MPKPAMLFKNDTTFLEGLGLDHIQSQPSNLGPHCSYCGKDLPGTEGTPGVGPLIKRVEQVAIRDSTSGDIIGYKDEIKYSSSKLLACNDCCLNLVERAEHEKDGSVRLDKYGEVAYSRSRTKFHPFD